MAHSGLFSSYFLESETKRKRGEKVEYHLKFLIFCIFVKVLSTMMEKLPVQIWSLMKYVLENEEEMPLWFTQYLISFSRYSCFWHMQIRLEQESIMNCTFYVVIKWECEIVYANSDVKIVVVMLFTTFWLQMRCFKVHMTWKFTLVFYYCIWKNT